MTSITALTKTREVTRNAPVTSDIKPDASAMFIHASDLPQDSIITKSLWDENTKAILHSITSNTKISPYTPTLLKNNHIAIQKSQQHLIDLMKYYEGDNYYYYEAVTTPYPDKGGTFTSGFGTLTNKPMTQEESYKKLGEKIEQYAGEVENFLNRKLGKNTFEKLPNSIKEGLIDLCYNKGLNKISQNSNLLNAIKNKDYSTVVTNLAYVKLGKTTADKSEDPGLYRRSLNRMILATRDLKGNELKEAKSNIDAFYQKAIKCHKTNHSSTNELDKIYENFKYGKISGDPISVEAEKFTVDNSFKGKGVFSVAKTIYENQIDKKITFKEFYEEFKRVNRDPKSISVGQQLTIPNMKSPKTVQTEHKNDQTVQTEDTSKITNITDTLEIASKNTEKKDKKGFWSKVGNGIATVFKAIGKVIGGFLNIFNSCSRQEENPITDISDEEKTSFQKMLKNPNTKITQSGDLQLITQEHTIQKGESIWRLSKEYEIDENILAVTNNIKDKTQIKAGETINIQKLGYKVEKGDNLYRISKKFGLTQEILKDINNIDDIDKLDEGQMLEIPGFVYTVKPKDTLFAISKRVGVKLEDLIKINNLNKDGILTPGQQIKIVYNDSDFAVSNDKKTVKIDKTTNTKTETIDMSGTENLANRPLLKEKRKVNGKVVATRAIFNPTSIGPLSGKTIIVNAGHGYSQDKTDRGTPGKCGMEDEWLINYDNAIRLTNELCAKGAKVIFLQGKKRLIMDEIKNTKQNSADIFISVHVNSHDKLTQDRTQIYYAKQNQSKKLSDIMEKKFDKWIPANESISQNDKFTFGGKQDYAQSKHANYDVLTTMEARQNKPSVLWEVAFMVSPKGRERMSNPQLMKDYAKCMADAVVEYYKN